MKPTSEKQSLVVTGMILARWLDRWCMSAKPCRECSDTLNVDFLKLKEKTRIAYTDPRQYQTTSCTEEQEQNQSHSKSDERDGNGLVICCLCHQQHYHKLPSDGPLMAIERKADREKHGGGQWRKRWRRAAEHAFVGSPGKTSPLQKPIASSGWGLMCFKTQRGLKKTKVQIKGGLQGNMWG